MELKTVRLSTGDAVGAHPDRVEFLVGKGILQLLRDDIYVYADELDSEQRAVYDTLLDIAGVFV